MIKRDNNFLGRLLSIILEVGLERGLVCVVARRLDQALHENTMVYRQHTTARGEFDKFELEILIFIRYRIC